MNPEKLLIVSLALVTSSFAQPYYYSVDRRDYPFYVTYEPGADSITVGGVEYPVTPNQYGGVTVTVNGLNHSWYPREPDEGFTGGPLGGIIDFAPNVPAKVTTERITLITRLGKAPYRFIDGTNDFDDIVIQAVAEIQPHLNGVEIEVIKGSLTPYPNNNIPDGVSEIFWDTNYHFENYWDGNVYLGSNSAASIRDLRDAEGNVVSPQLSTISIGRPATVSINEFHIPVTRISPIWGTVLPWNSYRNSMVTKDEFMELRTEPNPEEDFKRMVIFRILNELGLDWGVTAGWSNERRIAYNDFKLPLMSGSNWYAEGITDHDVMGLRELYGSTGAPLPGYAGPFKDGYGEESNPDKPGFDKNRKPFPVLKEAMRAKNPKIARRALFVARRLARQAGDKKLAKMITRIARIKDEKRKMNLIRRALKRARKI